MRETIGLTGRLVPEDLTPQMREEFVELYRQWRAEQPEVLAAAQPDHRSTVTASTGPVGGACRYCQ